MAWGHTGQTRNARLVGNKQLVLALSVSALSSVLLTEAKDLQELVNRCEERKKQLLHSKAARSVLSMGWLLGR